MNNQTRKQINSIQDRLTEFKSKVEEQEKFDNLPDGLQNGDKGSEMQSAIEELENALSSLETVDDTLCLEVEMSDIDDAFSSLDNSRA